MRKKIIVFLSLLILGFLIFPIQNDVGMVIMFLSIPSVFFVGRKKKDKFNKKSTKKKELNNKNAFSSKYKETNFPPSINNVPKDFTLIDIETTGLNEVEDDIIEIGAIKVRDLQITKSLSKLCNTNKQIENSHIHGITNNDLVGCPFAYNCINELLEFIGDDAVLAYNAPFDVSFINLLLINNIKNTVVDVLATAKKFDQRDSYKLDRVKKDLRIHNDSHRAESDCETALEYYRYLINNKKIDKVAVVHFNNLDNLRKRKQNKIADSILETFIPDLSNVDKSNPFFGKYVCFTGELSTMTRSEAYLEILKLGGIIKPRVTLKTNILIVGYYDTITAKEKKANEYNKREDINISIIDEDTFIDLLSQFE